MESPSRRELEAIVSMPCRPLQCPAKACEHFTFYQCPQAEEGQAPRGSWQRPPEDAGLALMMLGVLQIRTREARTGLGGAGLSQSLQPSGRITQLLLLPLCPGCLGATMLMRVQQSTLGDCSFALSPQRHACMYFC